MGRKPRKNNPVPQLDPMIPLPYDKRDTDELTFAELLDADPFLKNSTKFFSREKDIEESSHSATQPRLSNRHRIPTIEIDLHGLILTEAIHLVDSTIRKHIEARKESEISFKIITGKGRRSGPSGSILASAVHKHIKISYQSQIRHLQSSPAETAINGLPIRGYFIVILKR